MENIIPKQEQNELPKTQPEEILFETLQEIGDREFSEGSVGLEDEALLRNFIAEGRAQLETLLTKRREELTHGMNEQELDTYNVQENEIKRKFDYLFVYPDTDASYKQL